MKLLIAEFGTDHYYQADGFFNSAKGPWLADEVEGEKKKRDEGEEDPPPPPPRPPPAKDDPAYKAAAAHSAAAYAGLTRTDPEAVWVYQTWIWRGMSNATNIPCVLSLTRSRANCPP